MVIMTHGKPDVERALLKVQIADAMYDAATHETGGARTAARAQRLVLDSVASLSETCQAAGATLTVRSCSVA